MIHKNSEHFSKKCVKHSQSSLYKFGNSQKIESAILDYDFSASNLNRDDLCHSFYEEGN